MAGANLAAEHLLARGFRKFAYFSLLGLEYVEEHQQAFQEALRVAGHRCGVFAVQPQVGSEPAWNLDMTRLGVWLKEQPKPLAVFTWNSGSARELIYACMRVGLAVPEEIAVLSGSDDDLFCEVTPVPISAIQLGCEQIGYRAAQELGEMMSKPGNPPPADVLIPPHGDPLASAHQSIRGDGGRAIRLQQRRIHGLRLPCPARGDPSPFQQAGLTGRLGKVRNS